MIPDTQFFEGESAFSFLGLTRTQRLYGFAGWWVFLPRCAFPFALVPTVIECCAFIKRFTMLLLPSDPADLPLINVAGV